MPPLPPPQLSPIPGGSVLGSIGSQFRTIYTETLSHRSPPPTYTSSSSDYVSRNPHNSENAHVHRGRSSSCFPQVPDGEGQLERVVQNLSRDRVASLAIQARIKQIPLESEETLRSIVVGAVTKGILKQRDIQTTCTNSFMSLPTDVSPQLTPENPPCLFSAFL
jgi:hypothetical protein